MLKVLLLKKPRECHYKSTRMTHQMPSLIYHRSVIQISVPGHDLIILYPKFSKENSQLSQISKGLKHKEIFS